MRDYILAHDQPLTRGALVAALGGDPRALDRHLSRLLTSGEICADGKPRARRYRAPDLTATLLSRAEQLRATQSSQALPDRGVYPLYDTIVDLGRATTDQLTSRTGLTTQLVTEQGRRLTSLGLVSFTGAGKARVWLPVESGTSSKRA